MVGEIGIDSAARDRSNSKYPFLHQVSLFRAQLALAAELRRPVSVHTVQCHGHLLDILRELAAGVPKKGKLHQDAKSQQLALAQDPLPPKIMLHSYSGSPDIVRALLKLPNNTGRRFYFSFSIGVNARSPKAFDRIRAVPEDRILIESDLHDASGIDSAMLEACKFVATAKGWTLLETAEQIGKNAAEFLGGLQ